MSHIYRLSTCTLFSCQYLLLCLLTSLRLNYEVSYEAALRSSFSFFSRSRHQFCKKSPLMVLLNVAYFLEYFLCCTGKLNLLARFKLSQVSSVKLCFQLFSCPLLPFLNWHTVFLLNSVPVPFRNDVKAAEWYYSQVGC